MGKEENVQSMTDTMRKFIALVSKRLPDDVTAKLEELKKAEDGGLAKVVYDTMEINQKLALELDRPSCQDTGVLQFFVKCGDQFPLLGKVEQILTEAVLQATVDAPLRHNSVETFDEYNTGKNIGKGVPSIFWEIVPDSDAVDIDVYMAG
ncbi:MAG TPA: L(+)-tartrate dehydratase subunit alpha, partial [Ruminococcaceae bacterium]|nr:L(+)-tartrate dehydratase subunit alpha [Oscillospiraceae bacterium]